MSLEPVPIDAPRGTVAGVVAPPAPPPLLAAALAQLTEGVIVADAGGRIQFVNEAAVRLHGVARLDIGVDEYATAYQLLTEDGRPYPSTELPLARAVIRGETVDDARWRIRRPDGSEIVAAGCARPVLGPGGERLGAVLTLRDDTPRADATRAERRAAEILERVADAHVAFDRELRYMAVNAAGERSMQRRREELLGRTLLEAFPGAAGSESERQYRRVLAEGVEVHFAEHYVGDGLDNHVEVDAYPTDEGGVAVFWREVTARVRTEAALRESEARYRTLFDSIDVGFCVLEMLFDDAGRPVDYRFVEANPAFERQTGLVNAIGRTAREMVPDLEYHWIETYGRVATTGEPVRFQNGSEPMGRWFDVYAIRVGRPEERRVALLFTDISVEKAAEREREQLMRALDLERSKLATVFAQSPSILALVRGPEHVFELANDAYLGLIGHRDVIGKPLLDAVPELRGQGFEKLLDAVLATGEPFVGREVPTLVAREAGAPPEERFFDFVYLPVTEVDGSRSGVIAHGTDVTEQVRARREIERLLHVSEDARAEAEEARADAEAANRAKSEFLAMMSHELRTPLNAIGGYAELMEMGIRGPVTPPQVEDLRRIQASQRHLLGLVNEVLNYARIETGTVRYDMADVPLASVVASVEPLVAPQLAAKGLTFTVVPCPAGLVARADREKVRQVLLNLLSNAIKFTDPGGRVSVECSADDNHALLRVRDSGIGIPTAELGRIFEPFVQVNASLTRTHEGTGLGLAISRDLARGMGGELTVESRSGVGSTFTLVLKRG